MMYIFLHNNKSTAVLGTESVSWSSLNAQIGNHKKSQLSCTKATNGTGGHCTFSQNYLNKLAFTTIFVTYSIITHVPTG